MEDGVEASQTAATTFQSISNPSCSNGGILPLGYRGNRTCSDECLPPSFTADDDAEVMMDTISRIRLVQFQKDTEEPMGITLK
ncbi:hypothetical protein ANCCAN_06675, partial [Ancylostoma caninum]